MPYPYIRAALGTTTLTVPGVKLTTTRPDLERQIVRGGLLIALAAVAIPAVAELVRALR